MSSNGDQDSEGEIRKLIDRSGLTLVFIFMAFVLAYLLFLIADNWNNKTPITFGHIICFSSFGLCLGGARLVEKAAPGERFTTFLLLLALAAAAFVILYFWKGISMAGFFSILMTTAGR